MTKLEILLVDGDKITTRLLKRGLEKYGHKVDAFTMANEATIPDTLRYDSAVICIRMPEMNGFELARELWMKNKELQVCFMSTFEILPNEARKTMPSLKSHCFVKKPVIPSKLALHIQSHFARHK